MEKQLKVKNLEKKFCLDYLTDSVSMEFEPLLITKEKIKVGTIWLEVY